ncbi:MAG: PKD domain-containing protein [Flavobacteriales bacterium]|nr:PKD domain-containing protein [Flavobacteriales bacterium]
MQKKIGVLILSHFLTLTAFAQHNNAFRFKITGNGYSDETIIRLINGATENFDSMYDAWKLFSPNPNVPSIYTEVSSGQELSINSLPEFTEDKSITLYTNIPTSGTYTLSIDEIYPLTSNYKISLTEITSNTHYRILGDTALIFTFNTQQNNPSFTFNLSTPLTYSIINETCFEFNDGSLTINNAGNTNWGVEITDTNSLVIATNNPNSNLSNFNNLVPGNYYVSVTSKGITDEFSFSIDPSSNLVADFNLNSDTVYLSEGAEVIISNTSQNAQNYSWNFGDGGSSNNIHPTYFYSSIGNYNITLSVNNSNCVSERVKQVTVLQTPDVITSINEKNGRNIKLAYFGNGNYQLKTNDNFDKKIVVFSITGKQVFKDVTAKSDYNLNLGQYSSGIYIISVLTENGQILQEKIVR